MTSIGQRGYTILKENLSPSELASIKKELTVKPFINEGYGAAPNAFPIYCESVRKLYLPRYYGLDKNTFKHKFRYMLFYHTSDNYIDKIKIDNDNNIILKDKYNIQSYRYLNYIYNNGCFIFKWLGTTGVAGMDGGAF